MVGGRLFNSALAIAKGYGAMKYVARLVVRIGVASFIAACGPNPGSIHDTPSGAPFVLFRLPEPSQVDDASDFERKLRAEFANFARSQGLELADNSDVQQQQQDKRHVVSLMAYERRVSLMVDWNGGALFANTVAVYGDATAKRPLQVYEALFLHLRATNIPFTVEDPRLKGKRDG